VTLSRFIQAVGTVMLSDEGAASVDDAMIVDNENVAGVQCDVYERGIDILLQRRECVSARRRR